jgi:hypothetical protein
MRMATACTQRRQTVIFNDHVKTQHCCVCREKQPYAVYEHVRDSARVNAWCRIVRDHVVGSLFCVENTITVHEITKYVLDIQSEHYYISNKWYTKYQLRVSATILAIIKLYSTYKVTIQYMWCILERRDLVYSSWWHELNLIERLQYLTSIYYILTCQRTNNVHNQSMLQSVVASEGCVTEG